MVALQGWLAMTYRVEGTSKSQWADNQVCTNNLKVKPGFTPKRDTQVMPTHMWIKCELMDHLCQTKAIFHNPRHGEV